MPSTGKIFFWLQQSMLTRNYPSDCLSRSTLEGLAEEKKLGLVIDRQYTGTGNTTKNVGTGTLEERPNTFLGNNLATGIKRGLVLDGLFKKVSVRLEYIAEATQKISSRLQGGWFSPDPLPPSNGICTYFTRRHHHTPTDGVERIRSNTGTSGHSPAE